MDLVLMESGDQVIRVLHPKGGGGFEELNAGERGSESLGARYCLRSG